MKKDMKKSRKRRQILTICLVMTMISICGCSKKLTGVAAVVDDFYQSDYEYTLTRKTTTETGEEVTVEYEGKVIASPYEEYVKVVEPQESALWTECYYTKKGFGGKLVMRTSDEVVEQALSKRDYPYGYGEELEFVLEGEETVDGVKCEVYKAQYTQTVGGGIRSSEALEAVISQKYYIDAEKQQLVMLYTDLEDLYRKNAIVNSMVGDSSLTLEEAEQAMEGKNYAASEVLKVFHYNEKIEMTVLK